MPHVQGKEEVAPREGAGNPPVVELLPPCGLWRISHSWSERRGRSEKKT
jgi:hypothetical protein